LILTSNKGRDSQGRLGAVLRHMVRLSAKQYADLEYHPFRFFDQGHLLDDWSPNTTLPTITPLPWATDESELQLIFPERYKLLRVMLAQLLGTGSLTLPVGCDSMAVEEIFGQLFTLTPLSWRPHLSLATYTFNNPEDYGLAAFHQRDARVRKTLERMEESDIPATGAVVDRYLSDLFNALQAEDWQRAALLIQRTSLPNTTTPPPNAVRKGLTDTPAEDGAPPADNAGASPTSPPREHRPPPTEEAHHPHWQGNSGSAGKPPKKRGPWLPIILILVVILAAAGWYLTTQRNGGPKGEDDADAVTLLVTLRADGLASLLDRYEQLMGQLLADETRDLDLREAMQAASQTIASRVKQAATADTRRLDQMLSKTREEQPRSLDFIAAELRGFLVEVRSDHARVAALEQVLADADPVTMRTAYIDSLRRVDLGQLSADSVSPLVESLNLMSSSLTTAAEGMVAMASDTDQTDDAWQAIATQLDQALTEFPADLGLSPRVFRGSQATAAAYVDLRQTERRAGLKAAASAVPYSSKILQQGNVANAARALEARLVDLAAAGAQAPPFLAQVAHVHELGREPRLKSPGSLSTTEATKLLGDLTEQCASATRQLPCDDPTYKRLIARWKLEAWRALDGPGSATGKPVLDRLGNASLPQDDRRSVDSMVSLLNQMSTASDPAPRPLVEAVSDQEQRTNSALFKAICTGWLSVNRRQASSQLDTFNSLYQRLQTQLVTLRESDNDAGPRAFAALQATSREIMTLNLGSIEDEGSRRAATQAARQFFTAVSGSHLVRIARIDLELLNNQDYAGTRHQVAHPVIRISQVRGATARALYEFPAPAMPAATGAGFEPASLEMRTAIPLRATDRLLLTASEPGGSAWFHMFVESPQQGHVAAVLAGLHQVEVSPQAMQAFIARPDALPPFVDSGDIVATVRIVLERGFWADLGRQFPDLP